MYYLIGNPVGIKNITKEQSTIKIQSIDTERVLIGIRGTENEIKDLVKLINIGDLIEYNNNSFYLCKRVSVTYDERVYIMNRFHNRYDRLITAIYKPNSKSDYIKVWERDK